MQADAQSLPKFFWRFIKRWPFGFAVLFLAPLVCVFDTVIAYSIKTIVDGIVTFKGPAALIFQQLSPALWMYVGSWLIIIAVFRTQNFLQAYFFPQFEAEVRTESLRYVLGHSANYFSQQFAGNMAEKINNLPKSMYTILGIGFWNVMATFAVSVSMLALTATISGWCTLVLICWVVIQLSIILYFGRLVHLASEKNAADKNHLGGITVDIFSNITSQKLFANTNDDLKYVQKQQDAEIASHKKFILAGNMMRWGMDIPMFFTSIGLLYFLIIGWQKGFVTAGDFAFVMQCSMALMTAIWRLGEALPTLFYEIGAVNQALVILRAPHEITDVAGSETLQVKDGRIEFDNVTFNYEGGKSLFQNKNIVIKPGTKVGLVGFSGSGKTTFANLILRMFELGGGRICIDGQDISRVTQDSLRSAVAMIPQDTSLFHRTLLENIRYGKPGASDQDVMNAAINAHCHDFIIKFPEGYQTEVGERGIKLSGGQRQRIAIARAFLKDAPILIMDEATSALDSETEKQIQESLHKLMTGRTTIVIAHRLSTLIAMDRILVFDKGQLVEDGSHEQLLQKPGVYARLWQMQAGGFLPEKDAIL